MAEARTSRLSELLSGTRRVALVGLAKNTGKTQALAAVLAEHAAAGLTVGVTSIGRDGEAHDVIDARIDKPRLRLRAGTLVATTAPLLRQSGLQHELLARPGARTPLGDVVLARLQQDGIVEVAGPGAAADVSAVANSMLQAGADQVLIDGAIDRRAASSPQVADGLVIATGAVLGSEPEAVVQATVQAVELVRLPVAGSPRPAAGDGLDRGPLALPRQLVLDADRRQIATLLREHPDAERFTVEGALGEDFLEGLLAARTERAGRALHLIAADPTKVFLSRRSASAYRRQGLAIEVLRPMELKAITVNPVAPQSHVLDSQQLRGLIAAAIEDVPVLDVLDPSYPAAATDPPLR